MSVQDISKRFEGIECHGKEGQCVAEKLEGLEPISLKAKRKAGDSTFD